MSSCIHIMLSGPRKGAICGRPKSNKTRSEVPVCFHHTPERLGNQAKRQRNRISNMTSEEKVEENKVVMGRLRARRLPKNYIESHSDDCDSCSDTTEHSDVTTVYSGVTTCDSSDDESLSNSSALASE